MDELYLGEIRLLPYMFIPMNMLPCDGRSLSIQQNQALYSLLGVNFGGNPSSNFNLPDLRGAAPVPGTAYYIATSGLYPMRD